MQDIKRKSWTAVQWNQNSFIQKSNEDFIINALLKEKWP